MQYIYSYEIISYEYLIIRVRTQWGGANERTPMSAMQLILLGPMVYSIVPVMIIHRNGQPV